MKTYKAIIVDDEPTAREILERHLQKIDKIAVVATCKNAIEAFSVVNSQSIDLIFLDINMPEISGLSFAKAINKDIKVIITTAYREYAVDGFDLQAVDYLLKPISLERLIKAINKFLGENIPLESKSEKEIFATKNDFIFVRADRKMIKVNFSDIQYIESLTDYIKIHTKDKLIVTRETISGIESKLPPLTQKCMLRSQCRTQGLFQQNVPRIPRRRLAQAGVTGDGSYLLWLEKT